MGLFSRRRPQHDPVYLGEYYDNDNDNHDDERGYRDDDSRDEDVYVQFLQRARVRDNVAHQTRSIVVRRRCWCVGFHLLSILFGFGIATLYHREIVGKQQQQQPHEIANNNNNNNTILEPPVTPERNDTSSEVDALANSSGVVFPVNAQTVPPLPLPDPPSGVFPRYNTPILAVGYPRSGSLHVHKFFQCNGLTSQHYCCCGTNSTHWPCEGGKGIGRCMHTNLQKKRNILQSCGNADVFAEMDMEDIHRRLFLPQHFHLDKFTQQFPNATFLLTRRSNPADWASSVSAWFDLQRRFMNVFQIHRDYPGFPQQALIDIYTNHTEEVREYVLQNPSHALVEIEVDAPGAAEEMVRVFGGSADCWPESEPN